MARARTIFRCGECGGESPKWAGRCPSCQAWNTLVEEAPALRAPPVVRAGYSRAIPIAEVDLDTSMLRPTGVAELDRVLSGGLVPGSATLVGGEPGIGKSTLLLQMVAEMAKRGATALYLSAEESAAQVRLRAERLAALPPRLLLAADTCLTNVVAHLDDVGPDVVVVDSIQTVYDPEIGSAPGSVAQVRECAARLVREAKERGFALVLVGHVTKDGALAGPRVLEHVVDTVLSFEGDRHHALRLVRAVKHRFGGTDELGLFEMTSSGLVGVPDASGLFLADRHRGVPGSVVVPTLAGFRPVLVEVQALVTDVVPGTARRSAQGVDGRRLPLVLAVLQQRAGIFVGNRDVYALAVGGARVVDPGADLAVALAVASACRERPLPDDLVAVGELGLGGEVRQAAQLERRLGEAVRLGFRQAVVPPLTPDVEGIHLQRVSTLSEALGTLGV